MSQNALRPRRLPTSAPIRPACSYASCQRRWIAATLRVRQDERQRRCASTDCVRQVLPSQHKMRMSGFVSVAIFLLKQQSNGSSCMLSTEGLLYDARGRLYGSLIPTAIMREKNDP